VPTYFLDASATSDEGHQEAARASGRPCYRLRTRELDPLDRTLVSSDVDLNTLAQQFGVPVLDPEHPTS
jgi:hypothetical protein